MSFLNSFTTTLIIGAPIFNVNRHSDILFRDDAVMATALGERLSKARKLRKLTQQRLAEKSGVKQSSISELETGESTSISGDTLIGVCAALRIRPAWLVRGGAPMEPVDDPLPPPAVEVALNWLKLAPGLRESIAATIQEAAEQAERLGTPVSDETVERSYHLPPQDKRRAKDVRGIKGKYER